MWNRETASPDEGPRLVQTAPVATITARPGEKPRVAACVGKSVLFRGDLIGLEDMAIDGRIEGTIELREHNLTIGPDAHIRADITAKVVTVLGAVLGTITASDAVHIGETGSVEGNITSRRLAMADGAVVRGRVDTGRAGAADQHNQPPQPKASTASADITPLGHV